MATVSIVKKRPHEGVIEAIELLGGVDKFFKRLLINKELLSNILGNYLSLGVSLYTTSHFSPIIEAKSEFYPPDEDTKFKREALFKKKFTFNKKLRGR